MSQIESSMQTCKSRIFSPLQFNHPISNLQTTVSHKKSGISNLSSDTKENQLILSSIQEKQFLQPQVTPRILQTSTPQFRRTFPKRKRDDSMEKQIEQELQNDQTEDGIYQTPQCSYTVFTTKQGKGCSVSEQSSKRYSTDHQPTEKLSDQQSSGLKESNQTQKLEYSKDESSYLQQDSIQYQQQEQYSSSCGQTIGKSLQPVCQQPDQNSIDYQPQEESRSLPNSPKQIDISIRQDQSQQSNSSITMVAKKLIFGFQVEKFGRKDFFSPSTRILSLTPDLKLLVIRGKDHRVKKIFSISQIQRIEKGVVTQNIKRFKQSFEQQSLCVSIFLTERTLDIRMKSIEERELLMNCLQCLI